MSRLQHHSLNVESDIELGRLSQMQFPSTVRSPRKNISDSEKAERTFKKIYDQKYNQLNALGKQMCKELKIKHSEILPKSQAYFT